MNGAPGRIRTFAPAVSGARCSFGGRALQTEGDVLSAAAPCRPKGDSAPGRVRTFAPAVSGARCSFGGRALQTEGGQRPWKGSNLRSRVQRSAVLFRRPRPADRRGTAPLEGFEPSLPRSAERGALSAAAPCRPKGDSAPGRIRTFAPAVSGARCSFGGRALQTEGGQRPWKDSNLRSRLRRAVLYPLSYRGSGSVARLPQREPPSLSG